MLKMIIGVIQKLMLISDTPVAMATLASWILDKMAILLLLGKLTQR